MKNSTRFLVAASTVVLLAASPSPGEAQSFSSASFAVGSIWDGVGLGVSFSSWSGARGGGSSFALGVGGGGSSIFLGVASSGDRYSRKSHYVDYDVYEDDYDVYEDDYHPYGRYRPQRNCWVHSYSDYSWDPFWYDPWWDHGGWACSRSRVDLHIRVGTSWGSPWWGYYTRPWGGYWSAWSSWGWDPWAVRGWAYAYAPRYRFRGPRVYIVDPYPRYVVARTFTPADAIRYKEGPWGSFASAGQGARRAAAGSAPGRALPAQARGVDRGSAARGTPVRASQGRSPAATAPGRVGRDGMGSAGRTGDARVAAPTRGGSTRPGATSDGLERPSGVRTPSGNRGGVAAPTRGGTRSSAGATTERGRPTDLIRPSRGSGAP